MLQIALVVLSIALIVIGIKGFTKGGLKFSKSTTLTGTSGRVVGAICIFLGVGLIPIVVVLFLMYSSLLGN